jgi:DNA end-binding protein Ku
MPQSIWKGSISFGLVSIPIRLFSATEEKDISFRQVHREDGGRIRYKRVCSVDGEEVPYSDIAKGYELPDGEMVVLDDDDFANLPISSSRAVEVLSFVPAEQIDAVQMGKPYYCDPTGDAKPYVLLRDALDNAERVAIVKVALRQRERLAVLRPREGVLVMQTLLWPDEVRAAKLDFLDEDVTVRSQELTMAESYISALSADFDPDEFSDHYREALEEVIEAKVAGREIVTPEEQPESSGQVVDLMEALRRSVAEAKSRRGETSGAADAEPAAAKTAKAPAKKAAAKSAGSTSTGKKTAKAPAKKAAAKTAKTSKTAKATKKAAKSTAKKTAARKSA